MGIQDTFQLYGGGFQNKLLAVLLKDRIFLQQIHDIIDDKIKNSRVQSYLQFNYFN